MLLLTQTADFCASSGHRASPSLSAHFFADAEVLALSILRNSSSTMRIFS